MHETLTNLHTTFADYTKHQNVITQTFVFLDKMQSLFDDYLYMEDKIKGKEDLFKLKDIKKTLFLVVIFVDRFCDC